MIYITGQTYKHRERIKALGFKWNKYHRCWTSEAVSDATLDELCALKSIIVESGEQTLLDTRSHKERYGQCEDAPCCGCCGSHPYYGGGD